MRPIARPAGLGVSAFACVMTLGVLNGCDGQNYAPSIAPAEPQSLDQIQGSSTEPGFQEFETNNQFSSATPVFMGDGGVVDIRGSLSGTADIDVYDVGPIQAGDRIIVDVMASADQDVAAALFDADQDLLMLNDDRAFFSGQLDPLIDMVARHDSTACYLVVSSSPGNWGTGDYTMTVSKLPGQAIPGPRAQSVVLVFDGGSDVRISNMAGVQIPPFDAIDISPRYSGQTDTMIAAILSSVRKDYEGLNIQFYASTDGNAPTTYATRVFFGTYNPQLLGLADSVDEYNAQLVEEAIIYTDTFSLFMPLNPSLWEMGQAIGNVASHEIGHLLGLNHTEDVNGLMDISASANRMLQDQAFLRSAMHSTIFPAGYQNARQLVFDAVGGSTTFLTQPAPVVVKDDQYLLREALMTVPLSKDMFCSCLCKSCKERRVKRKLLGLE